MEKYVLAIFLFVSVVAISGFLTDALTDAYDMNSNNVQGAIVMNAIPPSATARSREASSQLGASVLIGTTNKLSKGSILQIKPVQTQKTATTNQATPSKIVAPKENAAAQQGAKLGKYVQSKTAQSGLIIMNGMPYSGTAMSGIVQINGIPISVNTLQDKGITLSDGQLLTPDGNDVQIKDYELRRRAIKLQFKK